MTIDQGTLIFFDASCLIAAAGSPRGGSGFLLSLCIHWIRGVVSHMVMLEAEHNIETKLGEQALSRYHYLLEMVPFLVAPFHPIASQAPWLQSVNVKDVHVVAAVLAVTAPYLLTLDRQLITQVNLTTLEVFALTPGDFIKRILPAHMDYSAFR